MCDYLADFTGNGQRSGADMRFDDELQITKMRSQMRAQVRAAVGTEEVTGMELSGMIRGLANLYEAVEVPPESPLDLSGPRWFLLLRLLGEECDGNCNGMTPTTLSHNQNVSKNTISSLLRGLEEQGLIQREIDPVDKRIFRIQLTDHGRQLMAVAAPLRIRHLNHLTSGLTPAEQEQLIGLLAKLFRSVIKNSGVQITVPEHETVPHP
jgi:DNA-binding MarR family transcriptional regulator